MAKKTGGEQFGPWLNGFTYDKAFDGTAWTLERGEDFRQTAGTVAAKVREEFERQFGALDVKVEGDTLHIRAVAPPRR
jgi:hypothetical protein